MNLPSAISHWQSLLGASQVLSMDAVDRVYGIDTTGSKRHVPSAVRIIDSACLPEVMHIASAHMVPVYAISNGKNWVSGTALPARDGCVLND